jgi:DNA-binding CsgD family transcriptional regulator
MNNYYIYIYLDPRKNGKYKYGEYEFGYEPFYIGKGKDNRWKELGENKRNKYFIRKINKIRKSKLEPITIKLYKNLNEKESFEKEIELINEIGRIDLKTGPLVNETIGGDGTSGYKHTKEIKKLISEKLRKNFYDIKKEFERRNYILLTEEKDYKTAFTKLEYICPNGHKGYICWNAFQRGQGCSVEWNEIAHKKRRKNFNIIKEEFEKRKYTLLTKENEYKNAQTKLNYICPKGHEGYIRWNNFKRGQGCSIECVGIRSKNQRGENNPNSKLTDEQIIQIRLFIKEEKLIQEIADIFGVSYRTISNIKRNKGRYKISE